MPGNLVAGERFCDELHEPGADDPFQHDRISALCVFGSGRSEDSRHGGVLRMRLGFSRLQVAAPDALDLEVVRLKVDA